MKNGRENETAFVSAVFSGAVGVVVVMVMMV